MKRLLIALTLVVMALPVAGWGMSSTLNNDFEAGFQASGIANGWEALDGTTPVCSGDSTTFHNGAWSQKVVSTTPAGVKAKFDVKANALCTVSVWVKAPVGVARVAITSGEEDTTKVPPTAWMSNTAANTWQKLTKKVSPNDAAIVIHCASVGGTSYFDDITLVSAEGNAPFKLWWHEVNPGGVGGNPFLCGGVFDGNVIFGQISNCVRMYGDRVVDGTPEVHKTPDNIGNDEFTAKCATMLDGYVYAVTGYGDLQQSVNWGPLGPIIPFNNNPAPRQKVTNDAAALVTDGTYLYAYDQSGSLTAATIKIYKWQMNHANGGSIVGNVSPFPITITGYSKVYGISYWNGKIYAAEAYDGGQILEIDTTTGAVTPLLTAPNLVPDTGGGYGQVARYGNKIFLGTHNGYLMTWELIGTTWTLVSSYNLNLFNLPHCLGLAVKGDGVNGKYAWVTTGGVVHFYQLDPPAAPGSLGDVDFDVPTVVWVNNAVVTATAPGGFWVETPDRTRAAHVLTDVSVPVGNIAIVKGTSQKSASGEREILAAEVTDGGAASAPVERLGMTQKSLGPATDSTGLATDGMLVTVSGTFKAYDYGNMVYIDDGSGVANDLTTGELGLKVFIANPSGVTHFDEYINWGPVPCSFTVTGILRLEKLADGTIIRRIDTRNEADVVLSLLP